jgi:cyclophilin family peptidyl-prolyl cis-trans isomerase
MRHAVIGILALTLSSVQIFAQGAPAAQSPAARRGGAAAAAPAAPAKPGVRSEGAGPVIVFETVKGTFEVETYPTEAPKTVEHILALVKRNFYNGQRVHRVVPGFVIQFGDPQTRDMTKKEQWGRGFAAGSGKPIGVAEFSKKRTHVLGAVAMAHAGDAKAADSQMYVTLAPTHRLDGSYTVFGQVISGMDVVQKIAVGDVIRRATVRVEAPATK